MPITDNRRTDNKAYALLILFVRSTQAHLIAPCYRVFLVVPFVSYAYRIDSLDFFQLGQFFAL